MGQQHFTKTHGLDQPANFHGDFGDLPWDDITAAANIRDIANIRGFNWWTYQWYLGKFDHELTASEPWKS